MSHVTSIGLDVHARSVAACAFNLYTGEVTQKTFCTNAEEIASSVPSLRCKNPQLTRDARMTSVTPLS